MTVGSVCRDGNPMLCSTIIPGLAVLISVSGAALGAPTPGDSSERVLLAIESSRVANSSVDDAALRVRLDRLQQEMEVFRQRGREQWLTERRAQEIRALVADVLADADQRAGQLGDDLVAGYDDGFVLRSADGTFELEVSGRVQIRHIFNHQSNSKGDDNSAGFEARRVKLKFTGHIINPEIKYSITGGFSRRTGVFRAQGIFVSFPLTDDLQLKIGRARSPLLREEFVSSKQQLLAERSLIAKTFDQERTIGATLRYETESFRVFGGFSQVYLDQRWLASARAEVLLQGDWKRLRDLTSFRDDEPLVAFGAGALYQETDRSDLVEDDTRLFRWTADVSVEFGGANIFAAIVGNHLDEENHDMLDQFGVVIQGGVFVTDEWELFARYVWGDADFEAPDLSVLTLGVNRYFEGHDLKFTADFGYGFNEVGRFWSSSGAGWRTDRAGEDGQIVVRTQMQVVF